MQKSTFKQYFLFFLVILYLYRCKQNFALYFISLKIQILKINQLKQVSRIQSKSILKALKKFKDVFCTERKVMDKKMVLWKRGKKRWRHRGHKSHVKTLHLEFLKLSLLNNTFFITVMILCSTKFFKLKSVYIANVPTSNFKFSITLIKLSLIFNQV